MINLRQVPGTSNIIRFGVFEVDLARAELRKSGLRLRLQEQPFQVLAALLERPGEIVGREELVRRIWPDGTVVDFDRGLNAAVTRLRQALSDSAEAPRFVETVARRGYRFIGSVENGSEVRVSAPSPSPRPTLVRRGPSRRLTAVSLILAGAMVVWWALNRTHRREFGASFRVSPLTGATGVEVNPTFSPEGTQLAYEWERDGHRHLYLKVVGPGEPIPLTLGEGAEFGPAWSPDGKWIAFIGRQQASWGIYVIAPVGGTPRKVADVAGIPEATMGRPYRHLDWTRDSRHIIASVLGRARMWESLLLVSVDTDQKVWLTNPAEDVMSGDREPAVSPDGRSVAFARGSVSSERIYMLPLTTDLQPAGSPHRIEAAGPARSPAWMANGRELIFTALGPDVARYSLSWLNLVSGEPPRRLAALGFAAVTPAVSRRGAVAYSTRGGEGTLWRQDLPAHGEAAPPAVKINSAATIQLSPEYSRDGSRIAFASERSGTREIRNCASDGSRCLQVTSMNGNHSTDSPRWSPEGKRIVFGSISEGIWDVYVVDANGGAPRQLTSGGRHGAYPYWSHDGKWIYYSSFDSGIWKIPAAGGNAMPVTRGRGRILIDSGDSKTLYYSDGGKLFRSAADGSGETELANDLTGWGSFAVAEDRIYYIHEDAEGVNEIRQILLSNGENSRVVRIDKPLTQGLGVSPDGRSLLYAEIRRRGNVMIAESAY